MFHVFDAFLLRAWFDELRKRRMAELKLALEQSEDSIGSVIQLFSLLLCLYQGTQFVVSILF